MSIADAFQGQMNVDAGSSEFNKISFIIASALWRVRTSILVKVIKVTVSGDVTPVGTVDVQPLVNMLDGQGKSSEHGTIYGVPFFRLQGGKFAVLMDPQVDDIGLAIFADRDISAVKASKRVSNPGSLRQFNMADGLYIGGFLNGTPEQYALFSSNGIKLVDRNTNVVEMKNSGITLTDKNGNIIDMKAGSIAITGNLTVTGSIKGGFGTGDQVNLQTHVHTGVQSGGSSTAPPTAGS